MTSNSSTRLNRRKPLSVWELPKRAASVLEFRKPTIESPTLRPHFAKILAFVFRNRFAIASQIQRRFPMILKSDRTTRRQLAEMGSLGLIATQAVTNVSPLMPKVYFVTAAGLRQLRKA